MRGRPERNKKKKGNGEGLFVEEGEKKDEGREKEGGREGEKKEKTKKSRYSTGTDIACWTWYEAAYAR